MRQFSSPSPLQRKWWKITFDGDLVTNPYASGRQDFGSNPNHGFRT